MRRWYCLARMKPWPRLRIACGDNFHQCSLCVETAFLYSTGTLISWLLVLCLNHTGSYMGNWSQVPQTGAWSVSLLGSSSPQDHRKEGAWFVYNSKVCFFPSFVQPVFPRESLSSAGAWRKSNLLKAAQISLHIPTQVFNAFYFFCLLCTALHNPLTSALLRSDSPSPIN